MSSVLTCNSPSSPNNRPAICSDLLGGFGGGTYLGCAATDAGTCAGGCDELVVAEACGSLRDERGLQAAADVVANALVEIRKGKERIGARSNRCGLARLAVAERS